MRTVISKSQVTIRLTDERWLHITENHDELAGRIEGVLETVANPDIIVHGQKKEFLAARKHKKYWMVVVYNELTKQDGFIITAFMTSRITYLLKKKLVWKKQS